MPFDEKHICLPTDKSSLYTVQKGKGQKKFLWGNEISITIHEAAGTVKGNREVMRTVRTGVYGVLKVFPERHAFIEFNRYRPGNGF